VVVSPSEALVELEPGVKLEQAIPAGARILQQLPPRLVIVAADQDAISNMKRSAEIKALFTDEIPPETLDGFDEVTRAFAVGWNQRRQPKQRPGDGLPWDAPGFEAP
jgi:hypothetical protein